METFEFQGKTTEEAVENACRELNISKDQMEIEIVEPGNAGIFGLVGSRKSRIKVKVPGEDKERHSEDEAEELAIARDALQDILNLTLIEANVSAEHEDGRISLNIEGDKSGLLIGRKGKTLDALQFIVSRIVNKRLGKRVQVIVDSESYRKRRQESLTQMALKMGQKAKRLNRTISTNALNPRDRRIVHLALRNDAELETKSRGGGLLKKVLIIPK